ncbi:hypothetical protein C8P63_103207 [Melghirimyces profundicolus]|uniref:Uncharacterized protein n=1 Tax=Melghirimyces profundicolus TaxID=1242148 RepID=A0A2T6C7X4_9BACL|nr:hypothetical protein C8P63_103207 [Melghirimyces profundicolus]
MKADVEEYQFGVATTGDLIVTLEKESGKDLSAFFKNHRVVRK